MKIEMQHQRPSQKNRKNSIKFKITTFEEISIDQSIDSEKGKNDDEDATQNNFQPGMSADFGNREKEEKKDYKQKVREAKQRA